MPPTDPASAPNGPPPLPPGVPRWVVAQQRLHARFAHDFLGGPRPWTLASVINVQKAGMPLYLAALMAYYGNTSAAAWIYLALHGTYGLVWMLKDRAFPDPGWNVRITFGATVNVLAAVLGWYWVFGWLLISGASAPSYPLPEPAWFALCISMCLLGCVLMVAADAQKYFTLRLRRGLITDGMFRWVRHPNYLGEMLIYASFALLVWHWLPALVLAWVWLGLFATNMMVIEARLARHPGWPEYRRRSWWLLPFVL